MGRHDNRVRHEECVEAWPGLCLDIHDAWLECSHPEGHDGVHQAYASHRTDNPRGLVKTWGQNIIVEDAL